MTGDRAVTIPAGSGSQVVYCTQITSVRARLEILTGDARLEFLRNSARRLKMSERIERAGW